MPRTPLEVLSDYQKDVERWKERGAHYRDIQKLTPNEVMFLRLVLHPTKRSESKTLTKELIKFICDKGVCTAQDIYDALGYSDKPVLGRLRIFQQFALVRREMKKYYIPTPRMLEIRERYLERIC